jgi:hypothetical protein
MVYFYRERDRFRYSTPVPRFSHAWLLDAAAGSLVSSTYA